MLLTKGASHFARYRPCWAGIGAWQSKSASPKALLDQKSIRFVHYSTIRSSPVCQASTSEMSTTPVKDTMEHKINQELKPLRLDLIDESHKHAGHAAMKGLNKAETHFNLAVVSSSFEGLTTIKRHKLVYKILADELAGSVHALSLKTLTPSEAQ